MSKQKYYNKWNILNGLTKNSIGDLSESGEFRSWGRRMTSVPWLEKLRIQLFFLT